MQQNSRQSRGPLVWRDMDQKALDDAYDQDGLRAEPDADRRRASSPRANARAQDSRRAAARRLRAERIRRPRHLSRATRRSGEQRAGQCLRPWRRLAAQQRRRIRLQAEPLVGAGAHAVVHRFHQCRAGRRRSDADVRAGAPRHRLGLAQRRKLRRRPRAASIISAHSSGSHLAACVLTRGWREEGLPPDFLQGRAAARRHVRSRAGAAVEALDLRQVHRRDGESFSPQRHLDGSHTPLILAYGTYETPEFQRQTRDFAAAVKAAGKAGRAPRRRGLQPFRNAGDAGQSLRPARPRGAAADGIDLVPSHSALPRSGKSESMITERAEWIRRYYSERQGL